MKTKSLLLSVLAMAGMLTATSCLQDELLDASTGDYVTAAFTINTPDGIATRAEIGDGTQANKVACAVFNAAGEEMTALRQYVDIKDKKATYDIRLVKGQEYRIVFFAYCEAAAAYDVTDMKNIKVLGNQASNIENRDAFTNYTKVTAEESMKAINRDVTLYRPFAQLNIGAYADDIEAAQKAGIVVTNSQVKVSNVYTAFNAYEDQVAGETSAVTFAMNGIPQEKLKVDINRDETIAAEDEEFEYLALNYLLVGDRGSEKSLTDVEFVWKTADGKTNNPTTTFKNIPVQRNYRTNIIGYILTNPAQFNIIIDEHFEKPDYIVSGPWDGVAVKEPLKNAEGAYMVSTPEEWAWFANKDFTENTTVEILANLDMNGGDFMMMSSNKGFTINGNEFTISNINVVKSTDGAFDNGDAASVSLFYPYGYGESKLTINDLTFANVKAHNEATTWYGHNAAVIASYVQGEIVLNNVHIYEADVKAMEGVGVLVGLATEKSKVTVNNCSVNDSYVSNLAVEDESGYVAAMVGKVAAATVTFTGTNSINNTDINAYYAPENEDKTRGPHTIAEVAVKRVETAEIIGADQVSLVDVSVTKIALANVATVSNDTELSAAIDDGKTYIVLKDGEYNIDNGKGKNLTIKGGKDAIIKVVGEGQSEAGGQLDYGLDGATVAFDGVTIRTNNATYAGYARLNATYTNCIMDNCYCLNGNSTFDGCTLNVSGNQYNIWTWGASEANFTNCTFNSDGKALLLYTDGQTSGNHKITVDYCIFNDKGGLSDLKAAIEIGAYEDNTYELFVNRTTVNGYEINDKGISTGTTLWANKNSMGTDKLNVVVDGVDVY